MSNGVWIVALTSAAIFCSSPLSLAQSVRTVFTDSTQVNVIRTTPGYSTILEFQSKPISAVLGDQDAFKLEFVGNAITIKPLVARAKSNLFVFTESDRFNCQLVTAPATQVDYIVRVVRKPVQPETTEAAGPRLSSATRVGKPHVTSINRSASYDGFTLRLISLTRAPVSNGARGSATLAFELSSQKKPYSFDVSALTLWQAGKAIVVESLYLDALKLEAGATPVKGVIALTAGDYDPSKPMSIAFGVSSRDAARGLHLLRVSTQVSKPVVRSAPDERKIALPGRVP